MAAGLRADWIAAYVETPAHPRLPESDRRALADNMRLAEQLGGRTAILSGHEVSAEVLAYAREHNVTKIVAGKPTHARWRDRILGSLVDDIVRGSGDIDVYVITGDVADEERTPALPASRRSPPAAYVPAVIAVAVSSLVSAALFPFFAASNLVMVYLLGVAYVASAPRRPPVWPPSSASPSDSSCRPRHLRVPATRSTSSPSSSCCCTPDQHLARLRERPSEAAASGARRSCTR
jgi:two-component system sensor histidine kinase KdpD